MGEGAIKKEDTILSLSTDITNLVHKLKRVLESRFERLPQKTDDKISEGKPQIPNILDEIIEELQTAKEEVSRIMSFILSDVLPKIN